jgi:UDP-glucose 4-epimerase
MSVTSARASPEANKAGAAAAGRPIMGIVRILVTGHRGHVGVPVAAHLRSRGHDVVGYDRVEGDDLLDLASLRRAADGCSAVVHAAAIPLDDKGSPEDIMAVNVLGTWNVLLAAEAVGVGRVVYFSSATVFGIFESQAVLPDYFPVDDAHPRRAFRPYGLSKCLAEDLCAAFTTRTGIPTVALRPAWVWDPGMYQRIEARWRGDPDSERTPTWKYREFVDVRDVADAVRRALDVPLAGHHRVLLCAADIAATEPSLVVAVRVAPSVPVRHTARFRREPMRSLFDCSVAARVLGWRPHCTWSARGTPARDCGSAD